MNILFIVIFICPITFEPQEMGGTVFKNVCNS